MMLTSLVCLSLAIYGDHMWKVFGQPRYCVARNSLHVPDHATTFCSLSLLDLPGCSSTVGCSCVMLTDVDSIEEFDSSKESTCAESVGDFGTASWLPSNSMLGLGCTSPVAGSCAPYTITGMCTEGHAETGVQHHLHSALDRSSAHMQENGIDFCVLESTIALKSMYTIGGGNSQRCIPCEKQGTASGLAVQRGAPGRSAAAGSVRRAVRPAADAAARPAPQLPPWPPFHLPGPPVLCTSHIWVTPACCLSCRLFTLTAVSVVWCCKTSIAFYCA